MHLQLCALKRQRESKCVVLRKRVAIGIGSGQKLGDANTRLTVAKLRAWNGRKCFDLRERCL